MGLQSDSLDGLVKQDKAPEKEFRVSEAASSISSSGNRTSGLNNGFCQGQTAETGNNMANLKFYENVYVNARGVSESSYRAMQSKSESLGGYLTGRTQYAPRTVVGGDARSLGGNHNVSVAGPTTSLRPRHLHPTELTGTIDTRVPSGSKYFPSAPSSNLSKFSLQIQNFLASNKVVQSGCDFRSALPYKSSHPARIISSPSNQVQGLFHDGPSSYRPNVHAMVGYDGYKMGEKSHRNSIFEDEKEISRGPRSRRVHTLLSVSDEKEQFGSRVWRERYNCPDFQTVYDNAKFFIIKSYSEDDVHKSIKYDVWSSTPSGNKKLDEAFHDAEARSREKGNNCPIFLFFSVNGSGQFLGLAEMIGPVDFDKNMDFWKQDKWSGFFPVRWHIVKDIPNSRLRHIILEYNDNRPVTFTRDTQEVRLKQGLEMLSIFKSYSPTTSMLDDYNFYEELEKSLQIRKSRKEESPVAYDSSKSELAGSKFEAGVRKDEQVSESARNLSAQYTSLAALARNLSLK